MMAREQDASHSSTGQEAGERLFNKKIFYIILGAVFCIWFFLGKLPGLFTENLTGAGAFGDSYGFVNSLFSGLAFAVLSVTVVLQYNELVLQRIDLKETKDQVKRQANAQEASEKRLFLAAYIELNKAIGELAMTTPRSLHQVE